MSDKRERSRNRNLEIFCNIKYNDYSNENKQELDRLIQKGYKLHDIVFKNIKNTFVEFH